MESGSERIIEKVLSDLEKRQKRVRVARGILEFLSVLLVSLAVASMLSFAYRDSTYYSVLKILVILAACFGSVWFLAPAILKKEENNKLALLLDKVSPGLGEDTLNAVLLLANRSRSEKTLGVSITLIEAHVDEVARRLESLDLSSAVSKEKLKSCWKPLAAALVLSLTALVFAPKEFRGFLFSFNILPEREPYLLELADIGIEYSYPAYTGLAPRTVTGSSGDVKALKGTHVTFRATPLKPLVQGEIVIGDNGFNFPVSSEGGKIKGEFTVLSDSGFFIRNKNGGFESRVFRIVSLNDKNPAATIESPTEDVVEIQEKDELNVFYKAEDDFGITKIEIVWNGKKGEGGKLIKQTKKEPKSAEDRFTWDFGGVEAEPGEVIEVRIKVYDNDTVSGPKAGVSNAIKVRLNDPRERHENILAMVEKALEEFLDVLGDEIENRPGTNSGAFADIHGKSVEEANISEDGSIAASQTKEIQDVIFGKIERAKNTLDEILDKMREDDYSDYLNFVALSNMKTRVEDTLNRRRSLLELFSAEDMARLNDLVTGEINEFEDDALFLDSMLKGERLRESLFYARDTDAKYNELKELLESLKSGGDEKTSEEIAKKIEEIRNLISQLAQKLNSLDGEIQSEFLNTDAFRAMDLTEKLDRMMELVEQGKIEDAMELLAALQNDFQGMMAALESGARSFSSASLSEEMGKLNEFISKIEDMKNREKSLKEKTEELKESILKDERGEENLLEFARREKEKLENLKNLISEAKDKVSGAAQDDGVLEDSLLDRLFTETQMLEHWLQSLAFEEALENAKNVGDRADQLKNLSRSESSEFAAANPEMEKSADIAKEIHGDLERLQKQTSRERMNRFAERQDEIEEEASELEDNIRNLSQSGFPFPEDIEKKLHESKGFMQGSSSSLRKEEISKAISNQEEAIKSLEQAGESAEGLLGKFQMSARGGGVPVPWVLEREFRQEGRGIDTSYVGIPSSAESQTGKEFKKSLLEALKGGSPEGYEELNKRYYERIIK